MGFLGGIGKAIGGVIKQVAPSIIKAVAPAATSLLKKVTGDIFSKGKDFLTAGLKALNLPSPIQSLAQKLLGKGLDKLNQLAQGGLDKLLQKITGAPQQQTTKDNVQVTTPPAADRIAQLEKMIADLQAKLAGGAGAAGGASGSGGAAATGSSGGATASTGSAATGGAGGTNTTQPSGSAGTSGGLDRAPDPSNYDMESISGQQKFNKDMTNFQMRLANMQNYWKAISDILKGQSDVQSKIGNNLR